MGEKFLKGIFKGYVTSIIVTIILLLLASVLMTKFELGDNFNSISYYLIIFLALVIGTVIAVKINGKKGWIMGGIMGIFFYLFLTLLTFIIKGDIVFSAMEMGKFSLCIVVGTIAGMLGVNI